MSKLLLVGFVGCLAGFASATEDDVMCAMQRDVSAHMPPAPAPQVRPLEPIVLAARPSFRNDLGVSDSSEKRSTRWETMVDQRKRVAAMKAESMSPVPVGPLRDLWEKRRSGRNDNRDEVPKFDMKEGYYVEQGNDLIGFDIDLDLEDVNPDMDPAMWMPLEAAQFKCHHSSKCKAFLVQGEVPMGGESTWIWFKSTKKNKKDDYGTGANRWTAFLKTAPTPDEFPKAEQIGPLSDPFAQSRKVQNTKISSKASLLQTSPACDAIDNMPDCEAASCTWNTDNEDPGNEHCA